MNLLVYLASYDDLAQIAIDSKPIEYVVPHITHPDSLMMHWLQSWAGVHYMHTGIYEIANGVRKQPDFDPWCYISQFPDQLHHFFDGQLNIDLVCFHYIMYGRLQNLSKDPKIKYIIVGSGHGVKEWWAENKDKLIRSNFRIIPINNAWSLIGAEHIFRWYVPSDFYAKGSIHPSDAELNSMREICLAASTNDVSYLRRNSKAVPRFYRQLSECPVVFEYKQRKSGTMFMNTMFSILHETFPFRKNVEIYIIGSDFDYNNTNTHFYSDVKNNKASNDPMRYGKEWLTSELAHLDSYVKTYNYNVYNLSKNPKSLLPFSNRCI